MECPRPDCGSFGRVDLTSVRPRKRYGSKDWTLFVCGSCGRTFSERRWTPMFRSQLPEDKVLEILLGLARGESLRRVASRASVDKNTVTKTRRLAEARSRWFQMVLESKGRGADAESVRAFLVARTRARAVQSVRPTASRGP